MAEVNQRTGIWLDNLNSKIQLPDRFELWSKWNHAKSNPESNFKNMFVIFTLTNQFAVNGFGRC